ncbi:MAG TPA: DUF4270 family protein [Chitinophagaceae bacterium]|nr:DUF4270 family protein [Chitinophagaceae bacterium]
MAGILNRKLLLLLVLHAAFLLYSCTRNTIEFGTIPENGYTNLVYNDTVSVQLSTVMQDSFATSGDTSFLIGRYHDPYLGAVSAKAFFQMTVPSSVPEIPASAKFDSLTFIIRPNDYYYGDTSKSQTIYINELANSISYSYNNKLYNTSNVAVKSPALGMKTIQIKPRGSDSIVIRLSDSKGAELYSKLQQQSTDITSATDFLNYFRGISVAVADDDTAVLYGLSGSAGQMVMRVHYHTTIPYPEDHYIDFTSLANDLAFNQVLTNRSGTGLVPGTTGVTEIPAEKTNGFSFMQPGTGLYLKTIFPSLRTILGNTNIVKLLKAELIIRPTYLSFDNNNYLLPSQVYLTQTDESNIAGNAVLDSAGTAKLYANPVIDNVYGENNYYRFNITPYINQMLTTAGSEDAGFFLMHDSPVTTRNVDRLIVNTTSQASRSCQLLLSVMIINK